MPSLKNIISDITKASNDLGIDIFCIGALARNIWYVQNNKSPRGTKDIDFAIYVPDAETHQKLKEKLIGSHNYTASSNSTFSLISPSGIVVDLLPFGEIENQGKVIIEGTGLVSINLDGFLEVYKNSLEEVPTDNERLKFCSIPAVVLLKLIAYDDRPENRDKDPQDIASIFTHYPEIESEQLWDEYSFLYEDDREHDEVGIMVIGYQIASIIGKNDALVQRVNTILEKAINGESRLADNMIQDSEKETTELKKKELDLLKIGINQGLEMYRKKP